MLQGTGVATRTASKHCRSLNEVAVSLLFLPFERRDLFGRRNAGHVQLEVDIRDKRHRNRCTSGIAASVRRTVKS